MSPVHALPDTAQPAQGYGGRGRYLTGRRVRGTTPGTLPPDPLLGCSPPDAAPGGRLVDKARSMALIPQRLYPYLAMTQSTTVPSLNSRGAPRKVPRLLPIVCLCPCRRARGSRPAPCAGCHIPDPAAPALRYLAASAAVASLPSPALGSTQRAAAECFPPARSAPTA